MRPLIRLLSVLLVVAVLAAACGDGDDTSSDPGPEGPTDGPEPEPTTDQPSPELVRTLAASSGLERAVPDPEAPTAELAAGLNQAGFDLWAGLGTDQNFVFSPMSIGHALLMAQPAAAEATAASISEALSLPDAATAHDAWNALDQQMAALAAAEDELTLSIADAIFPRLDVQPDQAWIDLLTSHHGAEIEALDFSGAAEASRAHINDWISDRTEGLIPDLLPEGFVSPATVLVLADAVYLEAQWRTVFGKYGTETADFTRLDGSTVPVDFMRELELPGPRGAGADFVAGEIPYVGDGLSMLVIVPQKGAFDEVRSRLHAGTLVPEAEAVMEPGAWELWLPPWETTSELDLLPWLTQIGAAPGEYPGIAPGVFLGAAVHGADIAVDEWGTVAAAATALGFLESGPPQPSITVKADTPFLYLIRHVDSGLVLFAGQVVDPTA